MKDFLPLPQERTGRNRSHSTSKAFPASPRIGVSRESHSASDLPSDAENDARNLSDSAAVFRLHLYHEKCLKKLESATKTYEEAGNKNEMEVGENLTSTKIARLLHDHATKLRIWAFECDLGGLPDDLDPLQREGVNFGIEILESLNETVFYLETQCRYPIRYKPASTLELIGDSDEGYDEYGYHTPAKRERTNRQFQG
jgi:hypothetical protein